MALTLPEGERKRHAVEAMFDRIAPRYDLLNGLISLGTHRGWKRAAARALGVGAGAHVVDLACGTGDLAAEAARLGARVTGIDLSSGMLRIARERGTAHRLVRASADALPLASASADGVTCGFALRNFVAIEPVLSEIARVLRPGGRAAFVEIDAPENALAAGMHRLYFERLVPLLGGMLSDRHAYAYLPASSAYLPSEDALRAMCARAGFRRVHKRRFLAGAAQLLVAERGPDA